MKREEEGWKPNILQVDYDTGRQRKFTHTDKPLYSRSRTIESEGETNDYNVEDM